MLIVVPGFAVNHKYVFILFVLHSTVGKIVLVQVKLKLSSTMTDLS